MSPCTLHKAGYWWSLFLRLWVWDSGAEQSHGAALRSSSPCLLSWVERPNSCMVVLKSVVHSCCFFCALLFQGMTVCAVMPINKAMSSKVLCAWSWVCRANGRWWSLTGRLLALGIWGCALGQDIGTQAPSSVFCFHEMSGLPYCLLPAIWPCHTEAWWQQREQPQTETSEILNENQPSFV